MKRDESLLRLRSLVMGAAVAAVGVGLALPLPADAQDAPAGAADAVGGEAESLDVSELRAMMGARGGGAGNTDDLPAMDSVVKGLKKAENAEGTLFDIYYAADPAAKNPSELYGVIPSSLLGTDLLLATSVNSGPRAGYQWSDYLVRFERRGNNLALMVPDLRYKENTSGPVGDSVKRTYTPSILTTLPIKAAGPGGSLVVDLTPLTLDTSDAPGARGAANPGLSRHPKVKVFPENVLIDAEIVTGRGSSSVGMSYSFRRLPNLRNPQSRYWPRVADERVGYFLTASQDWGKPADARDTVDRYINRWRIEKLDPSLEMSPPKEPIIFYVEKTVPVQWRRYVQDGIAEWNKAFEKIGIVGAIEVRQQTDSQYADVDPEDARYNFIRWIVTGRAFAMGPSRVDPRTGQILDADIIFDDSMLRYFQADLDLLGPKSLAQEMGPDRLQFWRDNPGFRPMGMSADDIDEALYEVQQEQIAFTAAGSNFGGDEDPHLHLEAQELLNALAGRAGVVMPKASRMSPHMGMCSYGEGAQRQLSVAHLMHAAALVPTTMPSDETEEAEQIDDEAAEAAAAAAGAVGDAAQAVADAAKEAEKKFKRQKLPERYLGLVLKEVVAHEVGHTLGLRHNFKASSWLSMDEIVEARASGDKPLVSSVMDYNPVLLFAGDDPQKIGTFITPVIGPYDEWAIEYGYTIAPRNREQQVVSQIAGKSGQKALAYATDEDTSGLGSPDPFVNRYDMGDDQVAWAKTRVELANDLLSSIEDWAVDADEPNEYLRSAFLNLFYEKLSATAFVARVVGGQHFSRSRFSDEIVGGNQPGFTPLDPAKQREALDYLANTVLADGFFELDTELVNKLVPSRMPGVSGWPTTNVEFPVHQTILNAQNRALSPLCDPTVLQRVYDAQLKSTAEDKFTAAELISRVSEAVWGDLETDGEFSETSPMLNSVRRNLQTQHLNYLVAMVDSRPGQRMSADLQNLVRYQLRRLSSQIGTALENEDRLDMASAAHLVESKSRIDRVLEAPYIDMPAGSSGPIIIQLGQSAK